MRSPCRPSEPAISPPVFQDEAATTLSQKGGGRTRERSDGGVRPAARAVG
jgi:hypothetical protein